MEDVPREYTQVDVIIVGAGASGLVTAKWMKEAGYTVLILERSNAIGGWWTECAANISQRHSLFCKENFRFSDLDYPEGTPEFPRHSDVAKYLKNYAQEYNIEPLVKFNRDARKLERLDDGRWKVTAVLNNVLEFYETKYVAIATGYQNEPDLPYIPGMETFKGESYHSLKLSDQQWSRLDNRKAVIIGLGNSGVEVACHAAERSQSVHVSARSVPWLLPNHLYGHPYDRFSNRMSRVLPARIRQLLLERSIININGHQKRWALEPSKSSNQAPPVVGQTLLQHVRNGEIKMAPAVNRVEGNMVYFEDDTSTQADLIVFCTGYKTDYTSLEGYLKSVVVDQDTGSLKLYKDVFSSEVGSSIAFIGLLEATALGGLIIAETQARWWTQLCKGAMTLPARETMEDSVAADVVRDMKYYDGSKRCLKLRDGLRYCDEISGFYGAKPHFYKHPSLALRLLFSCGGPAQYRLEGPDSLETAPDQVSLVPIPEGILWTIIGIILFFFWFFWSSTVTIMEVNDWCDDCLFDD